MSCETSAMHAWRWVLSMPAEPKASEHVEPQTNMLWQTDKWFTLNYAIPLWYSWKHGKGVAEILGFLTSSHTYIIHASCM
jgi:glycerol-3-phosphate acyltransferase PlsY